MPRQKGDPLLAALIKKLPPVGTDWPEEQQIGWLKLMAMAFGQCYGGNAVARMDQKAGASAAQQPKFRTVEHAFYVDQNGYARKRGGQRILPSDVIDTLHDMRGMDGDPSGITWADDSRGIGALGQVSISAA